VRRVTGPLDVCAGCAARWQRIVEALGMRLRVDPDAISASGL
jgi:hypothetical protein